MSSHSTPRHIALAIALILPAPLALAQSTSYTQQIEPAQRCVPYVFPRPLPYFRAEPAEQFNWQYDVQQGKACAADQRFVDEFNYFRRADSLAPEAEKPALWAVVKDAGARIVHQVLEQVHDPGTLALADKEFMLQHGNQEDAAKVWAVMKGHHVTIPDALVIAATPTQLKLAVSDDSQRDRTTDFTLNLAPLQAWIPPAGAKVTFTATYTGYSSTPIMLDMADAAIEPPKAIATPRPATRRPPAPETTAYNDPQP